MAFLWLACDEHGELVPPDGSTPMQYVAALLGYEEPESKRARAIVAELESYRLVRRVGHTTAQRIFLLVLRESVSGDGCEICGQPRATLRGARRCPRCVQLQRREWKGEALELWRSLAGRGRSDMNIAWHISKRLNRPLWGRSEDGEQGSGSGDGEGVIPALVELGVFPQSMLEVARLARAGGNEEGL
jgi:hypothetical protein